ncbi:hypothetical protein JZU68_03755, partial [bacterium]|nr:hypothetical protein [bacterium]
GKDEIVLIERLKVSVLGTNNDNNSIQIKGDSFVNFSVAANTWRYISSFTYNPILTHFNNDEFLDLVIVPNHTEQQNSQTSYSGEVYFGSVAYFKTQDFFNTPFMSISLAFGDRYLGDFDSNGKIDFTQLSCNSNREEVVRQNFSIIETKSWGDLLYEDTWGPYKKLFARCIPIDYNNDGLT